jgi:glycosyltransferase involved in cell wall biosynthesis
MRIALAVHHFPPHNLAGAELRAYRTAQWLVRSGNDLRIITVDNTNSGPKEGVQTEDEIFHGLKVHRFSFNLSNAEDQFTWEYDNPWIYDHLVEYFEEIKPDVFHLISGYILGASAMQAALAHQIPVVVTLTDYWFFCPRINLVRSDGTLSDAFSFDEHICTRCKFEEKRRYLIPAKLAPNIADWLWENSLKSIWSNVLGIKASENKFMDRNSILLDALSQASAIVCPSQFLIDTVRSRGLSEKKIHFIPHGIDKSTWESVENIRRNSTFQIGYLGQIDKHKGIHLLIEAFRRIQTNLSLRLLIYGDDSSVPQYTDFLKKLVGGDPRVTFMGRYDNSQIANIFSRLDIIVIPSVWKEIGPWVMYEAFETKTPVIASDIPNMSHIIHHEENGLLFERENSSDLAYQLQRLIEDDSLRLSLIDGIKPVKTIDDEMRALNQVYQVVLKGNNSNQAM